jgi:pimeloyl-ACP methyl ester carboxylesterase
VALSTGVRVRSIQAGPAGGAPVVLVHGWGIHAYLWRRTIPALVAAGRRVYALDLPGHGLSDKPLSAASYTLPRMTAHLAAYFDAAGLSRAPILAQSMGGRIAVEFARLFPSRVAALVLFGSVGFGDVPRMVRLVGRLPAPRGALSALLSQRWMVAFAKAFAYGRRARPSQEDIDAYWSATQFPDTIPAVRQALIDFDWRLLTPELCAQITAPALVAFGTRDRTVRPTTAARLVDAMPHGTLRWIRDAGHVANEEAPDEVNAFVVEFLSGKT